MALEPIERITIALIGDDAARKVASEQIGSFLLEHWKRTYPQHASIPASPAEPSNYVVQNIPFEGCRNVDIIEVTEFNENLPKFDGVILVQIKEKPLQLDSVKNFIGKEPEEDPYYHYNSLAKKISPVPVAIEHIDFYPSQKENEDQQNHEGKESFSTIENALKSLIDLKKRIESSNKLTHEKSTEQKNIIPLEATAKETVKPSSLSQKPSRKKLWLLLPAALAVASLVVPLIVSFKLIGSPYAFIALPWGLLTVLLISTWVSFHIISAAIARDYTVHQSLSSATDHPKNASGNASNPQSQNAPEPVTYSSPTQNQPKNYSNNLGIVDQATQQQKGLSN